MHTDSPERLVHELAEALTAAGMLLHAGQQIDDVTRLHEAIGKAIDQINGAAEVVSHLRTVVGSGEQA